MTFTFYENVPDGIKLETIIPQLLIDIVAIRFLLV